MAASIGLLASVNLLGGFVFGYNTGVIAGARDLISAPGGHWSLNSTMQGIVTSCILIGALFGSIIGGPLSDSFGRKVTIITLAAISVVFAPVLAITPSVDTLIVARTFLGIGVGMAGVICPLYVSENAPPERRGPLGICFQLAITIGILVAYISNAAFEKVHHGWRIMFALGVLPALALLVIAFLIPESLVWQSKRSGTGEHSTLLNGTNQAPRSLSERIGLFVRSRALVVGLVLAVAQQLTGINAFMFYAQTIFSEAGLTNQNVPTIGLGAWNVLATVVAIPLVDRLGRRPLLIGGTLVMTIACGLLAVVWKTLDGHTRGYLAIALLLLFVLAFELGDGPLFWMVASELFTPETKSVGASTLNAAQWIFNIILSFGFPIAAKAFGLWVVLLVFGVIGAVCTVLLIFFLPETKYITKTVQ